MTDRQINFIALIKAALSDTAPTLTAPLDLEWTLKVASAQQLDALVFDGLCRGDFQIPKDLLRTLKIRACKMSAIQFEQTAAVSALLSAFSKDEIDVLPLKGTVIQNFYPYPALRAMGDLDLLIREEQYPKIEKILSADGWEKRQDSDHDKTWQKGKLIRLELHYTLLSPSEPLYFNYYGSGWQLAHKKSDGSWLMSDEDFFIFQFVHFAKHYIRGGAGIKYLLDFYVWKNAHPNMDASYIQTELEKLRLFKFYENVSLLLGVWFREKNPTPATDQITNVAFFTGVWGTSARETVAKGTSLQSAGKHARFTVFRKALFPPFSVLAYEFPSLEKRPVLLPALWVVHIFKNLKKIPYLKRKLSLMSPDNVNEYATALDLVGLER